MLFFCKESPILSRNDSISDELGSRLHHDLFQKTFRFPYLLPFPVPFYFIVVIICNHPLGVKCGLTYFGCSIPTYLVVRACTVLVRVSIHTWLWYIGDHTLFCSIRDPKEQGYWHYMYTYTVAIGHDVKTSCVPEVMMVRYPRLTSLREISCHPLSFGLIFLSKGIYPIW